MRKTTKIRATQNVPFRPLSMNLRILNFRDIPEGVTEEIRVNWGDGSRNVYKVNRRTAQQPIYHSYKMNTKGMMNSSTFSVKHYDITIEHPSYLNINR